MTTAAGLVDGYPQPTAASHRLSGMVRSLLRAGGLDVSEAMTCGLGGGIGFLYAIFEYKAAPNPLLTVVMQHHPMPWIDAVAMNLGLPIEELHASSGKAALAKLDAVLDSGRPALISVYRGGLHPGVDPMEAATPYEVVIAGRVGSHYLTEDRVGRIDEIDCATVISAWTAYRKGRHQLQAVVSMPDSVDLVAAVRSALVMTADHLTGPVLGNSFDVNFGFSGMKKLATELRDRTTKSGWTRRFGTAQGAEYALQRLSDCLTFDHTAPAGTRALYAQFLDEAATLLDSPDLSEAAKAIRRAAHDWTSIAGASATADSLAGNPTEIFDELASLVDDARLAEEFAITTVRGVLG